MRDTAMAFPIARENKPKTCLRASFCSVGTRHGMGGPPPLDQVSTDLPAAPVGQALPTRPAGRRLARKSPDRTRDAHLFAPRRRRNLEPVSCPVLKEPPAHTRPCRLPAHSPHRGCRLAIPRLRPPVIPPGRTACLPPDRGLNGWKKILTCFCAYTHPQTRTCPHTQICINK